MNIEKIEQELNAKLAAFDKIEAEGTADLAAIKAMGEEIKGLRSAHAELVAIKREADEARAAVNAPVAGAANVQPGAPRKASVGNAEPNFAKDPKKGFTTPRDFFSAVLTASTGGSADERLAYLSGKRNGFKAAVGSDEHSTFSDPYGGFLVPAGFIANLLTTSWDGDPIAGRTTSVPMASPVVQIPARVDKDHSTSVSGGLRVYRRAEADTAAATRMETELINLQASPLMGVTYTTEELLRDSAITVTAMLEAGFREAFAFELVKERLRGTGAGQYLGILNSPALVTVAKESGQAADTIVYDNIIKMRARAYRYGNAIWMANQDVFPQLAKLSQVIGTGGSNVWMPSINSDMPDMLLGRPIVFHEQMSTLGDVGDIVLVNWAEYLEGQRVGITSEESIHVRFLNYERAFRFTVENSGQPWWRSALTPNKSASTLSPFVTLAAR